MKKLFLFFVISLFVGFISCEKDELVKPDPDPVPNKNVEVIVNITIEEGVVGLGISHFGVVDVEADEIIAMTYVFPQSKVTFPAELANKYFGKTLYLWFDGNRRIVNENYGFVYQIPFQVQEKNVINITLPATREYIEDRP